MKNEFGDMWSAWDRADLVLITGCSAVTADEGKLVMRSPSAKKAVARFATSDLALSMGKHITKLPVVGRQGNAILYADYGVMVSPLWPKAKLGLFQTRRYPIDAMPKPLLEYSINILQSWLAFNPQARVHMAFPGTADGVVEWWKILPLLEALPDNVTVWRDFAPYVPDIRVERGTAEHRLTTGPGSEGVAVGRDELVAHFYETLRLYIPRYRDMDIELVKLEFSWLFNVWGREWWERIVQYRTAVAFAALLDRGEEVERAIGNAFQTARNFYTQEQEPRT